MTGSVAKELNPQPRSLGGVSLEGSTLRSDGDANKHLYGKELSAKEIVREGKVRTPESGKPLIELLQKTSPKHASPPKARTASGYR